MQVAEKSDGAAVGSVVARDVAGHKSKASSGDAPSAALSKPVHPLPCPRCESMNTKFCYYNNYSVTQPRHFCRQCQRYWTAGGTLRNVPVGGGSRKKSRHQRTEPYTLQRGITQVGYPSMAQGNPYPSTATGQNDFQNGGFQHLLTQDIPGLHFAHQNGFQYAVSLGDNVGASMHPNYGTQSTMVAVPSQMSLGGENSTPKPDENIALAVNAPAQKNASPPHGSSSIEEEGSTLTNGYSNSAYEEGNAVSSMWHEMHDMDNVLTFQ